MKISYKTNGNILEYHQNGEMVMNSYIPSLNNLPDDYIQKFIEHFTDDNMFNLVSSTILYSNFLRYYQYNPPMVTTIDGIISVHLDSNDEMIIYISSLMQPLVKFFMDHTDRKNIKLSFSIDDTEYFYDGMVVADYYFSYTDEYTLQNFKVSDINILEILMKNIGKHISLSWELL